MPLPPALAKKLATRGILTENEGKILYYDIIYLVLVIHDLKVEVPLFDGMLQKIIKN